MTLSSAQMQSLQELEIAAQSSNGEAVELALCSAFSVGLHQSFSRVLIQLAGAQWHTRHEDVALALQELKIPESVTALERLALARHAYLEYDEHFALARKCTWALADIGTPEAKEALVRLASCQNPNVVAFAIKRLENWHHELHRKGGAQNGDA
jgi:HEAT repeat protein